MKFSLKNKSAVVTGGGSGIGRAICIALAEQGSMVHTLELQVAHANETLKVIEAQGGRAKVFECNVASGDEVGKVFQSFAAIGQIGILINNARIAHIGNL